MKGIIEFKDTLIAADRIIYVEQVDDDLEVTIEGIEGEVVYKDTSLADFYYAWREATGER